MGAAIAVVGNFYGAQATLRVRLLCEVPKSIAGRGHKVSATAEDTHHRWIEIVRGTWFVKHKGYEQAACTVHRGIVAKDARARMIVDSIARHIDGLIAPLEGRVVKTGVAHTLRINLLGAIVRVRYFPRQNKFVAIATDRNILGRIGSTRALINQISCPGAGSQSAVHVVSSRVPKIPLGTEALLIHTQ